MNSAPGNPDTRGPSRRAVITGGLAILAITPPVAGCSMVSNGVVAEIGNTLDPSKKPQTVYDLKDTGGAAGMIEQLMSDVWHGRFAKAFSIDPEEVARQVTRNPMGTVVANLKRLFLEALRADTRLRKSVSRAEIARIADDVLSRFGSDSLYDFTLSLVQATETVSARESIRRELLGPEGQNIRHYHGEFPALFDMAGNRPKQHPDDSRLCVLLVAQRLLRRPVMNKDLVGIESGKPKPARMVGPSRKQEERGAMMDYSTQRILAALAKRIDRRMGIVYERYRLEWPAMATSLVAGGSMPFVWLAGLAAAPTVMDFVADWRSKALSESHEELQGVISEIAVVESKRIGLGISPRLKALALKTDELFALLQNATAYNSRLEQQDTLVPAIYNAYVSALAQIKEGGFPASHRALLTMHVDLMVAECLFLNWSLFGTLISKLAGAGIFKL